MVAGVAGSGKSTVGRLLAAELGWRFLDGDELHPPDNIAKMAAGEPLSEADRAPWLAAVADWLEDAVRAGRPGVVACSALTVVARQRLTTVPGVAVVLLDGPADVIAARLARRRGHFLPPELLASQLSALQRPGPDEATLVVDLTGSPQEVVARVRAALRR